MDWVKQNLNLLIGVGGAVLVLFVLYKILSPKKEVIAAEYKVNVMCRKCRWQGTVTKYNMTCRKCSSKELDTL